MSEEATMQSMGKEVVLVAAGVAKAVVASGAGEGAAFAMLS